MKNVTGDNSKTNNSMSSDDWWKALFAQEDTQASIASEREDAASKSVATSSLPPEKNIDWEKVAEYLRRETLVECIVVEWNRGGLLVQHKYFEGFVPLSHILNDEEVAPRDLENYIGRRLKLRIIEQDQSRLRVILSERASQAKPGDRQKLLDNISRGQSIQGSVTTITKFGVFVDIGGVEGLIHISEISWRRVSQPTHLIKIGDQLDALVLKVDQARHRVALSLKQLHPNPWDSVNEHYSVGQVVMAEITEVTRYGAFAKLNDDLEGLIHISAMNLPEGCHPWETFRIGQKLQVRLQKINPAEQRLSLILADGPK